MHAAAAIYGRSGDTIKKRAIPAIKTTSLRNNSYGSTSPLNQFHPIEKGALEILPRRPCLMFGIIRIAILRVKHKYFSLSNTFIQPYAAA